MITVAFFILALIFASALSSFFISAVFEGYHIAFFHPFRLNLKIKPIGTFAIFTGILCFMLFKGMVTFQQYQLSRVQNQLNQNASRDVAVVKNADQQQRDKAMNTLQQYFNACESRNLVALDTMYLFPVERFFTMQNTDKEKFNERMKFEWRHHDKFHFIVNASNTLLTINKDNIIATIDLGFIKSANRDILRKIILNNNYKIISIRDYYEKEES